MNADDLHDSAYEAVDRGALAEAGQAFEQLVALAPDHGAYHYMLGLVRKYQMDWAASLAHNLRAIALSEDFNEAAHWNAGIAATALGDWPRARSIWAACGIDLPAGDGPIDADFGTTVIRLHPWQGGETLWAQRIDPVRARLLNVPLPESGHRLGDVVLHDGASTGTRRSGEREVMVFNALQRLEASALQTFAVFVRCDEPEDLQPLLAALSTDDGYAEDWTASMTVYCMRCSYGAPHRRTHEDTMAQAANDPRAWAVERNLGVGAHSREAVQAALRAWVAGGPNRHVDGVETREHPVPAREDGLPWWIGPDGQATDEAGQPS